jgi:hypothetical protein
MANRFWVGGTGTWDSSDTTHWASSSNGAGGQSVPIAGDNVTIDASSGAGTITVSHATLNVASLTCGAMGMTLDFATNDNNITITSTFSCSGTGTRTLNMGDGTWTFTAAGGTSIFVMTTTTNLTFAANGSTILFSATPTQVTQFVGGGLTYNNVTFSSAAANAKAIRIDGSNTFANLTLTNKRYLALSDGTTQTITGALTYDGGGASTPGVICPIASSNNVATLNVANATTLNYLTILDITKAGAGSITANNSYDAGGNTNITINAPAGAAGARVIGG